MENLHLLSRFRNISFIINQRLSNYFRKRRNAFFYDYLSKFDKPVSIIDIGGTIDFWAQTKYQNDKKVKILLLNLRKQQSKYSNIRSIQGDALNLQQFRDKEFDLVFSNSLIEHLETKKNQQKFANEVKRIGEHFFIQTPNKYFLIEPHFLLPFFFICPKKYKKKFVSLCSPKWYIKLIPENRLDDLIKSIRMLSSKEFYVLFGRGKLFYEKIFFMTKSFVIYN